MHRAVSDEFALCVVALLSPHARVDETSRAICDVKIGELDLVDALCAVQRSCCAALGEDAVEFSFAKLIVSSDLGAKWVHDTLASAGVFDAKAFLTALSVLCVPREAVTYDIDSGLVTIVYGSSENPSPPIVLGTTRGCGVSGVRHDISTHRSSLATAAAIARELVIDGNMERASALVLDETAAAAVVAQAMSRTRMDVLSPDAARAARRASIELAISPSIQKAWPLALPTGRLRDHAPDPFFEHCPLDTARLCFDAADEATPDDEMEWLLVCAPNSAEFSVCRARGRPRTDKRARIPESIVMARTIEPPSETRGAFFWMSCGSASQERLKDLNVFPRRSECAADDLRRARSAVDAAGFVHAHAAVWLNANEARAEMADAAAF
jgi:hypothetical protein